MLCWPSLCLLRVSCALCVHSCFMRFVYTRGCLLCCAVLVCWCVGCVVRVCVHVCVALYATASRWANAGCRGSAEPLHHRSQGQNERQHPSASRAAHSGQREDQRATEKRREHHRTRRRGPHSMNNSYHFVAATGSVHAEAAGSAGDRDRPSYRSPLARRRMRA
jgi:hypothetical protein